MSYALLENSRIYYQVTNYRDDAPWIVFLNGIMSSTSSWLAYQRFFMTKGYNIVCHNYRNQFKSSHSEVITFDNHVDDLHQLLESLHIRDPHIIGVSYGGIIGLKYAIKYQKEITSLSVIATTHLITNSLKNTVKAWYDFACFEDPKLFLEGVFPFIYHPQFLEENPTLFEDALKSMKGLDKSFYKGQTVLYNNLLKLKDFSEQLNEIQRPTLVITASDDIVTPHELGLAIHKRIKSSELLSIPNAAHGVLIEKEAVAKTILLGFLEKLRSDKDV